MNIMPKEITYKDYQVVVGSWGGVGTTMLSEYIGQYLRCNSSVDSDGLKHAPRPPVSNKPIKIVYVYGNPIKSLMSLFRRNHHHIQVRKLHRGMVSQPHKINEKTTLEEYASNGVDYFKFEEHFDRWIRPEHPHPILFVRFSKVWENLDILLNFLNIDKKEKRKFPKRKSRKSDPSDLSRGTKNNLEEMYESLLCRLEHFPAAIEVTRNESKKSSIKTKLEYSYEHIVDTLMYSTKRIKNEAANMVKSL
jgi:hypothetical protein